ncbi:hypothetical protein BDL97_04G126600, partial [Sphagnum fallax]
FCIGFSPVDVRGRPLLDLSKTGGWRAAFFIFGMSILNKAHLSGTSLLLLREEDDFRFRGIVLLTLTSVLPGLRPLGSGCGAQTLYLGSCTPPSTQQMAFIYISLYTMALGSGGIRPCVLTFGADQFDVEDPKEKLQLAHFHWFYFTITLGVLLALTVVVYISNYVSWGWGFGTLAIAMGVANITFFMGTPFYRHKLPSGSPVTRLCQVLVASICKWKVQVPSDESLLHEVRDKESAIVDFLTKQQSKLTKMRIQRRPPTPWRLCTITQVEELKILVRLIPIFVTTIFINTVFLQIINFGAQEALTMDRRLGRFIVPAASIPVVDVIFILLFIPIYDQVLMPFVSRYTKNPRGISFLQRIGIGLFVSILAAIVAACVERKRHQMSWDTSTVPGHPAATVALSAGWLIIPHALIGLGEVLASIGRLEFFYEQAPNSMRSLGAAFLAATSGLGAYLGSFLVAATMKLTGRNGRRSWISNTISSGHIDYYFWLLAVLSVINLMAFLYFASIYKHKVDTLSIMRGSLAKPLTSSNYVETGSTIE